MHPSKPRSTFTARLVTLFEESGLTQGELGERVEKSQSTVSDWLTHGVIPDGKSMLLLPAALSRPGHKVNGHWLLTNEGSPYMEVQGPGPSMYLGARAAMATVKVAITEVERMWEEGQAEATTQPSRSATPVDPAAVAERLRKTDAVLAKTKRARRQTG